MTDLDRRILISGFGDSERAGQISPRDGANVDNSALY